MRKCLPLITSIFVTLVLCAATTGNFAAAESPTVVPLWPAGALGFEARKDEPEAVQDWWVANVHDPSSTLFMPAKETSDGTAMVICPGGSHRKLVFGAEGVDAAKYFSDLGYA